MSYNSYTSKPSTRFGVNDSTLTYNPDTIKCGFNSATEVNASCNENPSCVAYVDNAASNKRCTLHTINGTSSKETTETGYTAYIKDYSNCKVVAGDNNSSYAAGFCITDPRDVNKDAKNKLIKSLESKTPRTLVISRSGLGKVMYVMYIPMAPTFSTANMPFSSTTLNPQILNIYFIITVDVEETYRFTAGDASNQAAIKFYVNGVRVQNILAKLTPGDHLVCLEIDMSKTTTHISNISITTNSTATTKPLDKLVVKPINFYTQVGDKYIETLNSVCTPENYLTSEYCKGLLKDSITANDSVKNKCLISSNGSYAYTGTEVCSDIIDAALNKTGEINQALSTDLYNAVSTWFSGKISLSSNLSSMTVLEIGKLNSMFDKLKTYSGIVPGLELQATRAEVAKYCNSVAGDVFSIPKDTSLCGKIYNDTALATYNNINTTSNKTLAAEINQSKEKLKYDYCTKLNADDTYRYETDDLCKTEYKTNSFLNADINKRCIVDNKWNSADKYCNKLSEEIVTGELTAGNPVVVNDDLKRNIKGFKNAAVLAEIGNIENIKKNNGKLSFEDYIVNFYSKQSDKDLNALLNEDYLFYCQSSDPKLNNNSSCLPIYKTFKDNVNIINSKAKMRNINCSKDELITTNLDTEEAKNTNTNNCKTLVTEGNLSNLLTFKDAMLKYCSTEKNIASQDCKDYYNTVSGKIISAMSSPAKASAFNNKESLENNTDASTSRVYQFIILMLVLIAVRVLVSFMVSKRNKVVTGQAELSCGSNKHNSYKSIHTRRR